MIGWVWATASKMTTKRTGTPFLASQLDMTIEASPPSEWPMKMIGGDVLGVGPVFLDQLGEIVCQVE